MAGIVTAFKALSLDEQTEAYPQITAAFNTAKDARRQQLEAEIRTLGFKPGEVKKPAVGWAGRGAVATWLKDEMAATGLPLEAFKVS